MPRLPDRRDVGTINPTPTGPAVSARELDMGGAARGLEKAGDVLVNVAEQELRKQDALDTTKADAFLREETARFERGFENDRDFDSYGKNYETGTKAIRESAAKFIRNRELRDRFLAQTQGYHGVRRERIIGVGQEKKKAAEYEGFKNQITTSIDRYGDPKTSDEDRAEIKTNIESRIRVLEQSGVFTPEQATRLRNEVMPKLALQDIYRRVQKGEGADLFRRIQQYNKAAPKQQQIDPGTIKIDGKGIVSFDKFPIKVMIAPNAPYMGRKRSLDDLKGGQIIMHGTRGDRPAEWFVQYGQKPDPNRKDKNGKPLDFGYHFYIAKDGTIIQGAPLDRTTNGARNRNRRQIHIAMIGSAEGDPTPEQAAAAKALASGLGPQLGIKNTQIWGHGEVQTDRDSKEAGLVAKELREKGYQTSPTQAAPTGEEPPRRGPKITIGGINAPPAPSTPDQTTQENESLFGSFTAQQRARLTEYLRKAARVHEEDKRETYRKNIESGLLSLRKYGTVPDGFMDDIKAMRGFRGTTNYLEKVKQKLKIGAAFYEETKDIETISIDEMEERKRKYAFGPGDKDAVLKDQIVKELDRAYKREAEQRRKDPAAAVDKHPIVLAATARGDVMGAERLQEVLVPTSENPMQPQPESPELNILQMTPSGSAAAIEARLRAQDALGIPEQSQRTITRTEATAIIPMIKGLPREDAERALSDAYDKVRAQYQDPELAKRVFRDALLLSRFQLENQDSPAYTVLTKKFAGEPITPLDIGRVQRAEQLKLEEMFMAYRGTGATDGLPLDIAADYDPSPGVSAINPVRAVPTEAQVDYVLEDPETRAALFDKHYGAGAFAAAMRRREQAKK